MSGVEGHLMKLLTKALTFQQAYNGGQTKGKDQNKSINVEGWTKKNPRKSASDIRVVSHRKIFVTAPHPSNVIINREKWFWCGKKVMSQYNTLNPKQDKIYATQAPATRVLFALCFLWTGIIYARQPDIYMHQQKKTSYASRYMTPAGGQLTTYTGLSMCIHPPHLSSCHHV